MEKTNSFQSVLEGIRQSSLSEHEKGSKFERLMQGFLTTNPLYSDRFQNVWLWVDFPRKSDLGSNDTGIDLVALTHDGDYWAIQCKFYHETTRIDKRAVDSFISTSSRQFKNTLGELTKFTTRLWISTTNNWGLNAEEAIMGHDPEVLRLSLNELEQAPVNWIGLEAGLYGPLSLKAKKVPYDHQLRAIRDASIYFKSHNRGKLIMACGTGKTFTSLKIAENETQGQGLILFLVPSIALLAQTLREWSAEKSGPMKAICICSDAGVSFKKIRKAGSDESFNDRLALPASTNVEQILKQFDLLRIGGFTGITVVFSTYQSIEIIAAAQKEIFKSNPSNNSNFGIFDLIICDEAHRTTGITLFGNEDASFVKVHNNDFLKAKKRLYMTATPRFYNQESKIKAAQADAEIHSMDNENLYGLEIYRIGFGEAVELELLSDYKVLILTISDMNMPKAIQQMLTGSGKEISTDDASKIYGCINALSKQVLGDAGILKSSDPDPMRRALAFCQNIDSSKKITDHFNRINTAYNDTENAVSEENGFCLISDHVDGMMTSTLRDEKLNWLRATASNKRECRVLTNVRCLSEGVDVPSLDAVLFLSAKNSQIDVVQSVGRVMRKADGKKFGYIIIPVVVPSLFEADVALDSNQQYKVVWSVLNALRAHDERFNAVINTIDLNQNKPHQILIAKPIPWANERDENSPQYDSLSNKRETSINSDGRKDNIDEFKKQVTSASQLALEFSQYKSFVFARMVEKVGNRMYWQQWADDIAIIAARYIIHIKELIDTNETYQDGFKNLLLGLQKNINPSISQREAIEMLAQHYITKPVFEALFEGYSFVKNNPISLSMQGMLDLLEQKSQDQDLAALQKFYDSVKIRVKGIDNAAGKQKVILELYDKFFKTAFPKMVKKLGIVYTPIEVVDFILHSTNDLLNKEFKRSISDENVKILDPFTGTGTFMTRLLQSGLIKPKDIERKYRHELHANEIVLLAYYIAAINIENTYHDSINAKQYEPFEGICLTDTFQLGEADQVKHSDFKEIFTQNSERVQKQKQGPIQVIIGNPPYSIGQKSANDDAKNQTYTKLDKRISKTYALHSSANLNRSLYDAYIKAFRWSTDRLDPINGGIISFVTNGAWIDGNSAAGFRKCIHKEFSSIYVFNLRGDQRTSDELSRKEGGKIFGEGSRTPIAITFLIKKPNYEGVAAINYYDIGDYITKKDKLLIIKDFSSILNSKIKFTKIVPNEHGDWINYRNEGFQNLIPLVPEKQLNPYAESFFIISGPAILSSRDTWVYNFDSNELVNSMSTMIDFYNEQERSFYNEWVKNPKLKVDGFVNADTTKISWTVNLKKDIFKSKSHIFEIDSIITGIYRPFCKQHLYLNSNFIERPGISSRLFPNPDTKNIVIYVSGLSSKKPFGALISNLPASYDFLEKAQCFPLYYYQEKATVKSTLFDESEKSNLKFERKDAISRFIVERAIGLYSRTINSIDIFYYVYGLLHHTKYLSAYLVDLKKIKPRIPLVDKYDDFNLISEAGKKLASLHLNYETRKSSILKISGEESQDFRVTRMQFSPSDKTKIIFNSHITIENIPEDAYNYIVNGKSAIKWVMECYESKINKESQIANDPNNWVMENPRYILDLLVSVIQVSIDTLEIVNSLPELHFLE